MNKKYLSELFETKLVVIRSGLLINSFINTGTVIKAVNRIQSTQN